MIFKVCSNPRHSNILRFSSLSLERLGSLSFWLCRIVHSMERLGQRRQTPFPLELALCGMAVQAMQVPGRCKIPEGFSFCMPIVDPQVPFLSPLLNLHSPGKIYILLTSKSLTREKKTFTLPCKSHVLLANSSKLARLSSLEPCHLSHQRHFVRTSNMCTPDACNAEQL